MKYMINIYNLFKKVKKKIKFKNIKLKFNVI